MFYSEYEFVGDVQTFVSKTDTFDTFMIGNLFVFLKIFQTRKHTYLSLTILYDNTISYNILLKCHSNSNEFSKLIYQFIGNMKKKIKTSPTFILY